MEESKETLRVGSDPVFGSQPNRRARKGRTKRLIDHALSELIGLSNLHEARPRQEKGSGLLKENRKADDR